MGKELNTKELKGRLNGAIKEGKRTERKNGGGNGHKIDFWSRQYKASVARDREREKNNWLFWVASILVLVASVGYVIG